MGPIDMETLSLRMQWKPIEVSNRDEKTKLENIHGGNQQRKQINIDTFKHKDIKVRI